MTWTLLALPPLQRELLVMLLGDVAERTELIVPEERTQAEVERLLPQADIVLGDWSPDLEIVDPGPRVAFIQQPSVGVDGIDLDRCAEAGVPVANTAGANTVAVAEWCLGATMAVLRKTVACDAAVRAGEWPQMELSGRQLSALRVGIVGLGAIGRAAADRFAPMGCEIGYWSRSKKPDAPAAYFELDELCQRSDVLVLSVALTPDTRGLIDERRIRLLPHNAVVVNAARGQVLDDAALVAALEEGRVGGAALDVFGEEPLPADSPLRDAPNIVFSPHVAGSTDKAAGRILEMAQANLRRVLDGEPVQDVLNGVDPHVRRRAEDD